LLYVSLRSVASLSTGSLFIFFFSRRRRHTSFSRDWSSDVCSSDLKQAREGKLTPAEMQGGCFTISSLGAMGGSGFTPMVNAPEVAILGVSRAQIKPVWNGKEFVPRNMLPISLSYDHRAVNGADAGRFFTFLTSVIADVRRLVL